MRTRILVFYGGNNNEYLMGPDRFEWQFGSTSDHYHTPLLSRGASLS
jgi:hypothetical protein